MERTSCQTPILTHTIPWSLLRFVREIQKIKQVAVCYPCNLLKKYTFKQCKDEVNQNDILQNTNTENYLCSENPKIKEVKVKT